MAKILICIPTYDRKIDVEILTTIARLPGHYPEHQFGVDFITGPLISYSRNYLCKRFLETDCDWLYFWDSDVVIKDLSFVEKLLETARTLNADVVGGVYRIKSPAGLYAIANYRDEEGDPWKKAKNFEMGQLTEPRYVDCIATGAMLIKREVLTKIPSPWFEIKDYPDARVWPEDFLFCDKVRAAGFKVAVDPRFNTYHYGIAAWPYLSGESKPEIK